MAIKLSRWSGFALDLMYHVAGKNDCQCGAAYVQTTTQLLAAATAAALLACIATLPLANPIFPTATGTFAPTATAATLR